MIAGNLKLALVALAALAAAGCTTAVADAVTDTGHTVVKAVTPTDVRTSAVRSIKTVKVERIAVMPVVDDPPQGAEPLAPGAGDAISAELYSQAAIFGGWEVVPVDDVMQAMQQLPPTTPENMDANALKLGRLVSADCVLYGSVERYKERVGVDYSAASPAAVTFALKFVDLQSGQVIWRANFAKSQKALSENIFNLVNFVQQSGRWVRAHEIAMEGVQQSLADLEGRINVQQNIKHFETGSYGQLKSAGRRYDSGSNGNFGQ